MVKAVEFRFAPFSVTFCNGDVLRASPESEVDLLPWCSLPDILFEGADRRFVGLSFPIDVGAEHIAQEFADSQKSEFLRWFLPRQVAQLSRYAGFGESGRLEMMWARGTEGGLNCEFASLFHGAWRLPRAPGETASADYRPTGYLLADFQSLLASHGLKPP